MSKIDKYLAWAQPCEVNNNLNLLRMKAFETNSDKDRESFFLALSLAFQRGDLIAYDLVETTNT